MAAFIQSTESTQQAVQFSNKANFVKGLLVATNGFIFASILYKPLIGLPC